MVALRDCYSAAPKKGFPPVRSEFEALELEPAISTFSQRSSEYLLNDKAVLHLGIAVPRSNSALHPCHNHPKLGLICLLEVEQFIAEALTLFPWLPSHPV